MSDIDGTDYFGTEGATTADGSEAQDPTAPTHPRFRARRAEVEDESLRRRNRKLLVVGVLIALMALAAAATQSALLDVDEVRIVGAERSSPDYLRQVSEVELGTPILGLDTSEIEARLVALPEVGTVAVSKSWGGVVTVEINERLPVARVESPGGTVVVSADGIVIEIVEGDDAPNEIGQLTEIAGAMFATQAGSQVPDVLGDALSLASRLPDDIAAITERIEVTVDSLELRVLGGGTIAIGDARDLDEKFDAVRAFLAEVDLSCLRTLNVRAPSVPVIVRNTGCS